LFTFQKTLKGYQYGYQMKGLGPGSKNVLFIFNFCVCLHFINMNYDLTTF
jgi:hypothetical protein